MVPPSVPDGTLALTCGSDWRELCVFCTVPDRPKRQVQRDVIWLVPPTSFPSIIS